ncbi:MAG: type II toxin-antitoxin system prevent-host-death family antitoxin, partial [Thermoanaerobaculia bacterium]
SEVMSARTIGAAQFKEKCLAILDEVGPEGIIVTKRGKPVAKLIPIAADSAQLIGILKDEIEIKGDILTTGVTWNAEP